MPTPTKMEDKKILTKHHLVQVKPKDEEKSMDNSEADQDDTVPLGLTGKAVCMQVSSLQLVYVQTRNTRSRQVN